MPSPELRIFNLLWGRAEPRSRSLGLKPRKVQRVFKHARGVRAEALTPLSLQFEYSQLFRLVSFKLPSYFSLTLNLLQKIYLNVLNLNVKKIILSNLTLNLRELFL